MSNIDKIRQEIERRKKRWMYNDLPITMGRYYEDRDLLAFIDSLPEETCKESLQVQETCKENGNSFTSLEEVAENYADGQIPTDYPEYFCRQDIKDAFIAGAKWMESQMPMPEDTVIFMKGMEEGRRLEREDRNGDNLPRYYGD